MSIHNTETTNWICNGPRNNRHPEEDVLPNERCPICDRDRATAKQEEEERQKTLPLTLFQVLVVFLIAFLGGLLVWLFSSQSDKPDPNVNSDPSQNNAPSIIETAPNVNSDPNQNPDTSKIVTNPNDYPWEPDRFTKGQRTLFFWEGNTFRKDGINAFKKQEYTSAVEFFEKAVNVSRNDPEVLILYNNAKARQQGNPLTLAAVVPVEEKATSAKEMLRGIAMAQDKFNDSGGANGRLLEIVIANDGNEIDNAKKVADQLVNDKSILGVIGHNASGASEAGLEIYEPNSLAMISPTSTSTSLESRVFFRTVPSDAAAGEKLAQHVAASLGLTKAVVFWNPNSPYSESLADAFTSNFEKNFNGTVVKKIDISNSELNIDNELSTSIVINNAQAALLFPNTGYTSVATAIAQANAKIKSTQRLKLLGGDALYSPTTLKDGGKAVEDLILAVPWFRDSPQSQLFKTAGKEQWRASINWRTAMTYDATQAFIEVFLDNPNPDRNSTLKGLEQIQLSSDETSGKALKFTSQGERNGEPVLVKATRDAINRPQGSDFGFELVK